MKREIGIDKLGRADLSLIRKQDHMRYLAEESPDGTITLVPLIPARIPRVPLPDAETETAGI
jgi:hypothetical protein